MTSNSQICVKCHACCNFMTFTLHPETEAADDKYVEFYEARGCKIKRVPWDPAALIVMVPYMCAHLEVTTGMCAIYAKRPRLCREYDGRWDPTMADVCQLPITEHDMGTPMQEQLGLFPEDT